MRILVLGGYGFIGAEIVRGLVRERFEVVGLGRDAAFGRRLLPHVRWIAADISKLTSPESWSAPLAGIDAVVNAAGALQDGARDDLAAVHDRAIRALVAASEANGVARFVQISAPGARADATTAFLRTKAAGDAALRASSLDWTILKPGLVIGPNAYGGTALLRALAALPVASPLVHAGARVQTVAIDDVVAAVVATLRGAVAARTDYDLGEPESRTLRETVRAMRAWMGLPAARFEPDLPAWVAAPVTLGADIAGAFGWRSPLRSTAMTALSEGVVCDPEPWRRAGGAALKSLDETLAAMPATAQDRAFARAELALPVMLLTLSFFWLTSGAIGFLDLARAADHLLGVAPERAATAMVAGGSALDIAVGLGLLVRRTTKAAALASIGVALLYLVAGTTIAPGLWLDPLGVYVKVIPAMALAAAAALMLGDR